MTDPAEKAKLRSQICSLPVYQTAEGRERPPCSAPHTAKFHFDAAAGACVQIDFEGCHGTDNVFDDVETCQRLCVDATTGPTAPALEQDVCALPPFVPDSPEQVACDQKLPRWSYDEKVLHCVPVLFAGCGATANLFDRQDECFLKCARKNRRK